MLPAVGGKMVLDLAWHQIRRAFGVLCVFLVLGLIGWLFYVGLIKPHVNPLRTTQQNAEQITNINITEDREQFFLGIKLFGLKFGVSRNTKKKPEVIGQVIKGEVEK